MSGRVLPGASTDWHGGEVTPFAECVLAPNASAWTLDGTNTWIVGVPGNGCVVVDPGPLEHGHGEAIEARVEDRGNQVEAVLLTHGHIDHSAGAEEFAERHNVAVRAWVRGGRSLSDRERIDVDGLTVDVLATPGHSSDSVSFIVDGVVLTGDTVLGRGTSLVAHPDGRLSQYLRSLDALARVCADQGITRLLPGHGPVLDQPERVIEYYLTHRHERLDQVRAAVSGGAVSAREVVERVYADVPREVWPAAEATVLAQLDYLREEDGAEASPGN